MTNKSFNSFTNNGTATWTQHEVLVPVDYTPYVERAITATVNVSGNNIQLVSASFGDERFDILNEECYIEGYSVIDYVYHVTLGNPRVHTNPVISGVDSPSGERDTFTVEYYELTEDDLDVLSYLSVDEDPFADTTNAIVDGDDLPF